MAGCAGGWHGIIKSGKGWQCTTSVLQLGAASTGDSGLTVKARHLVLCSMVYSVVHNHCCIVWFFYLFFMSLTLHYASHTVRLH